MLQSLRNSSPVEAQKILVVLSEYFLSYSTGESNYFDINNQLYANVLTEIRKRAYVREDDNSEKAKAKILSIISNEMSAVTLTPGRKKQAKERLGGKGMLPFSEYTLEITEFMPYFDGLGVNASHIKGAFERPDKYFHFEDAKTPITYFSKKVVPNKSEDAFIIFIIASRYNASLVVRAAWRVYFTDVSISDDYKLSDMLNIFLDRYGLTVRTTSSDWAKLIWYDTTSDPGNDFINIFPSSIANGEEFLRVAVKRKTSIYGVYEAYCIYAVNITKYKYDLEKHGVIVRRGNPGDGKYFYINTKG